MLKVVHMLHHRPGCLAADIAAFGDRNHAVCATPTVSKARYAAEYRVGVVLDSELVHLNGRPLCWASEQAARSGRHGTMGDSWLVPTPCTTLAMDGDVDAIAERHGSDGSGPGMCFGFAAFRPRDVVEVWVIPALSRIRAIKVRADVPAQTMAEARTVAADMGLPFYVFPAPQLPPPVAHTGARGDRADRWDDCRPGRDDE